MLDESTYKAFREQWEQELAEAKSAVVRLTSQIRDLDKTWRRLAAEAAENAGETKGIGREPLTAKVSAAVEGLPNDFDSPDVWRAVEALNPGAYDYTSVGFKSNCANALKRLVEEGRLDVSAPGAGNRPARFKKRPGEPDAEGGSAVSA